MRKIEKRTYVKKERLCNIILNEVETADEDRVHNLFFPIKRIYVGTIVQRGYKNHLGAYDILNKVRDYIWFDKKYKQRDEYLRN